MLTPCIGCRRPVPVGTGGRCHRCRSAARHYRDSGAWHKLRAQVRASGRCARCGAIGVPLEVHHVIRLADDLAAGAAGELEALCRPCHLGDHHPSRR